MQPQLTFLTSYINFDSQSDPILQNYKGSSRMYTPTSRFFPLRPLISDKQNRFRLSGDLWDEEKTHMHRQRRAANVWLCRRRRSPSSRYTPLHLPLTFFFSSRQGSFHPPRSDYFRSCTGFPPFFWPPFGSSFFFSLLLLLFFFSFAFLPFLVHRFFFLHCFVICPPFFSSLSLFV